jgi:glucosamine 6-phosphate synthetase-like amidotransferase/phosphosugar isomerase protein
MVDPFVAPVLRAVRAQLPPCDEAVPNRTDVDQPRNLAISATAE